MNGTGVLNISESDLCWSSSPSLSRKNVYRIFVVRELKDFSELLINGALLVMFLPRFLGIFRCIARTIHVSQCSEDQISSGTFYIRGANFGRN